MFLTFKLGLLLGLSIIISIGSQNLFLIQQAMRDEYTYLCALICVVCDIILILLGAAGVSVLFLEFPLLKIVVLIMGILFLTWYGVGGLRRGFAGNHVQEDFDASQGSEQTTTSLSKIILLALSFSLLNPAAILDTVIIIGGSASHYENLDKYSYVAGTITASFVWFFGLAAITRYYAERIMSNLFWRMLDLVSGGLMLGIAAGFVGQVI